MPEQTFKLDNFLGKAARPHIMAVLNATPDSFSDGGNVYRNGQLDVDLVLNSVEKMLAEGADIIDVGGESTRPGAAPVGEQQELDRVIPILEAISSRFEVLVSVDTSTAVVIQESAAAGAAMINDVRSLCRSGALEAASNTELPVCLMHMVGEPGTMQKNPNYSDIVKEVSQFLLKRVDACIHAGIARNRIVLDPGFGFGKDLQHNIELFKGLPSIVELGFPVMAGVSRKAMIGAILGKDVSERMVGSVTMAMLAVQNGAKIVRVHDVAATRDALKILAAVG